MDLWLGTGGNWRCMWQSVVSEASINQDDCPSGWSSQSNFKHFKAQAESFARWIMMDLHCTWDLKLYNPFRMRVPDVPAF